MTSPALLVPPQVMRSILTFLNPPPAGFEWRFSELLGEWVVAPKDVPPTRQPNRRERRRAAAGRQS